MVTIQVYIVHIFFSVLFAIILVILCCTRHDSALCNLCSDQPDEVEKTIVPLDDENPATSP